MKQVAIINYGMGNVDSVFRAVEECGGNPVITRHERQIVEADFVILPGVGAFGDGIASIRSFHLDEIMAEAVLGKKAPFLGICLGMQMLASKGYEFGEHTGLGWIDGEVLEFVPDKPDTRIPHVGWNEVHFDQSCPLFNGLSQGKDFYFVHSFHFECQSKKNEMAHTPYCGEFTSAVAADNIFGVQFHPEKSQKVGFQILKNFLSF